MRKQSDAKTCILYTETWVCQRQNLDGLNLGFKGWIPRNRRTRAML